MLPGIYPTMRPGAPHGVGVVGPHAVAVDESALSWTISVVLDRRDGDYGTCRQSGSAPNPLVVSAEALGAYLTLRHAACTPTLGQFFLPVFQMSRSASMPA